MEVPTPPGSSITQGSGFEDQHPRLGSADRGQTVVGSPGGPLRKRKRVPVACSACRARKSRCDGCRPRCSSCNAQDIECVYAQTTPQDNATVPKTFLDLVERRLASVERDVRMLKGQLAGPSPLSVVPETYNLDGHAVLPSNVEVSGAADDSDDSAALHDATDGVGTIEFADDEDSTYFGPSSNIAFTRNIRRSISSFVQSEHCLSVRAPPNDSGQLPNQHTLNVSRPQSPVPRKPTISWMPDENGPEAFRVPPEDVTSQVIRHFFSDPGALFPYVHEGSFRETYDVVKSTNFRRVQRSWLGLLNMILAIATSAGADKSMTTADRAAHSEIFFNRAKALCLNQMMAGASVETVQVMLLMTQYLQGTQRSIKTWTIHGLAVKAAMQLGLHSEEASRPFGSLEREIRTRTWYGCIVLDRTLSMTFGRPASIPEAYIKVHLPSHFVQLSSDSGRQTAWSIEENSTTFFNATITLYQIAGKIIDSMYGSNLGVGPEPSLAELAPSVLSIEQEFLRWQGCLPPPLKLVDPEELLRDDSLSLLKRFQVIITLRYHNLRILAHRRILEKHLHPGSSDFIGLQGATLLSQLGQRSKTICFQSAECIITIVSIVTHSTGPQRGLLGAWWFSLYYTFNAALTVLGLLLTDHAIVSNAQPGQENPTALRHIDILDRAIDCLPRLDRQNRMVEKCAKFTAALRYCVLGFPSPRVEAANAPVIDGSSMNETSEIIFGPDAGSNIDPNCGFTEIDFAQIVSDITDFANNSTPGCMNHFAADDLFWA